MCGIAGAFYQSTDVDIDQDGWQKALRTLSDRGPDQQGHFLDPGCIMLHTRLAIIDPGDTGRQPMYEADQRYVMVYNGELFNHKELRHILEQKGHSFFTESDAEVVLKWFIQEGVDGLAQLNGFFAIAIYDRKERCLWLSRDRMGEKPLYFAHHPDSKEYYFGSYLRALHDLGFKPSIDHDVAHLYFHLNYIPSPYCIWKHCHKVEPGTVVQINGKGEIKRSHFYQHPQPSELITFSNHQVSKVIHDAVQRRMVSDVPVGAFLSSGLDSSIVCALAGELNPSLQTYTAGFKDHKVFDESAQAVQTAKHLKLSNEVIWMKEDDLLQSVRLMWKGMDEPYADSSAIAMHELCRHIHGKYKVMLSGDGADELFAGYRKHRAEWRMLKKGVSASMKSIAALTSVLPVNRHTRFGNRNRQLQKWVKAGKLNVADRYWNWAGFSEHRWSDLMQMAPTSACEEERSYLLRHLNDNATMHDVLRSDMDMVLEGDMLYKTDHFGMMNAVEVRSPFLDPEVVMMALQMKTEQKLDMHTGKKILREVFADRIPEEVLHGNKRGFEVPLRDWLLGPLREEALALIQNDRLVAEGFLNPQSVNREWKRMESRQPGDAHAHIWAVLNFQKFLEQYAHG